jgi:hypothetical protein
VVVVGGQGGRGTGSWRGLCWVSGLRKVWEKSGGASGRGSGDGNEAALEEEAGGV